MAKRRKALSLSLAASVVADRMGTGGGAGGGSGGHAVIGAGPFGLVRHFLGLEPGSLLVVLELCVLQASL